MVDEGSLSSEKNKAPFLHLSPSSSHTHAHAEQLRQRHEHRLASRPFHYPGKIDRCLEYKRDMLISKGQFFTVSNQKEQLLI